MPWGGGPAVAAEVCLAGRTVNLQPQWGGSSAGRASRSQCEGREFDPPPLHHPDSPARSRASPEKIKKPLRINALGLFSCPRTVREKFRQIGDHIAVTYAVTAKSRRVEPRSSCIWACISSRRTRPSRRSKPGDERTRLSDGAGPLPEAVRQGRLACLVVRLHLRRPSQDDQPRHLPDDHLEPRAQEGGRGSRAGQKRHRSQ